MNVSIFRRRRITVESNAYLNFDHFRRSSMCRGIVILYSNRNCDIGLRERVKSFLRRKAHGGRC